MFVVTNPSDLSDERRSWHYPPPWDGVKWQPARTPIRDAATRAWAAIAFITRAAAWAFVWGTVLTVFATAAAMAGV